jgi:glucose-6-phosphate 1-dehydrogenase
VTNGVDSLVIFGATGDLAKLETFPALVSLVDRGVVNVPVVGIGKSGWGLDNFRDYAATSLQLNGMDPTSPAASKMLKLLRYVDGDLNDKATYAAMRGRWVTGRVHSSTSRCHHRCSGASPLLSSRHLGTEGGRCAPPQR